MCEGDVCECVDTQGCSEDCGEAFQEYVGAGDACASLGLEYMDCISAASCEVLLGEEACEQIRDRAELCDGDDRPPQTGVPPAGGTSAGVSCTTGFGSGVAGGANLPGPQSTCDQGFSECSDGHEYRVICVAEPAGTPSCTCFVDGAPGAAFPVFSGTCPSTATMNAACGWNLVRN